MKHYAGVLLFLIISLRVVAQEQQLLSAFRAGLSASYDSNYTCDDARCFAYLVEGMSVGNPYVLTVTKVKTDTIKATRESIEKARSLKYDRSYTEHIKMLIDGNLCQRNVGYMLIAFFKDTTYYEEMWHRFETFDTSNNAIVLFPWIMKIFPRETDRVFAMVMNHREWYDVTMGPAFMLSMDRKCIVSTLYKHLSDTSFYVRDLTLNMISILDTSATGDAAVVRALKNWLPEEKKSAIVALQMRPHLKLKKLLQPYAHEAILHDVVTEALYMSMYNEDVVYAKQLCTKEESANYADSKEQHLLEIKVLRQQLFRH